MLIEKRVADSWEIENSRARARALFYKWTMNFIRQEKKMYTEKSTKNINSALWERKLLLFTVLYYADVAYAVDQTSFTSEPLVLAWTEELYKLTWQLFTTYLFCVFGKFDYSVLERTRSSDGRISRTQWGGDIINRVHPRYLNYLFLLDWTILFEDKPREFNMTSCKNVIGKSNGIFFWSTRTLGRATRVRINSNSYREIALCVARRYIRKFYELELEIP